MDSDFNRPMAHQPEVLNIKSKEDIWKNELGLDGIVNRLHIFCNRSLFYVNLYRCRNGFINLF